MDPTRSQLGRECSLFLNLMRPKRQVAVFSYLCNVIARQLRRLAAGRGHYVDGRWKRGCALKRKCFGGHSTG